MLAFHRYSRQGVDRHIQTIRAVWPAKPKGDYAKDKPSEATSPFAPRHAGIGLDAVIQSKQRSISWAPSGIDA